MSDPAAPLWTGDRCVQCLFDIKRAENYVMFTSQQPFHFLNMGRPSGFTGRDSHALT